MITPVPQLPPAQMPKQPEPREDGDSFVRVLAGARQAPLLGPVAPSPGHGPAVVSVSDILAPQPGDDAVLSGGKGAQAAPANAERFNEDGFFGASISAAGAPAIAATGSPIDPLPRFEEVPMPQVEIRADARPTLAPAPIGARASDPDIIAAPAPVTVGATPRIAAAAVAQPRLAALDAIDEPAAPHTLRAKISWPQPRATVQVVLRELEQGVHVAARVDALDEGERVRLHDEIAALLARHGRVARGIRINAATASFQENAR